MNHRRALRLTLALLLATIAVFLLVGTDPNRGFVQDIDDAFLRAMVSAHVGPLVWLAKALSFVGSVWVNWPLRVGVMIVLAAKRRWLQLSAFVLAVMSSELLIGVLKAAYARPRGPESLIGTSGFSFPSGHAVAGAVTAVGLVVCLLPPGPKRWKWEFQAAFFAVLMALSRTYLGAHWLSDVIGGGLLGASLAIGWPALLQELRERWQNRPARSASQPAGRAP